MTKIEEQAFYDCDNLESVTSDIAEPFAINDNTFSNTTYSNAPLYVPKGTVETYKATDGWKNFKLILEEGTSTGIADVVTDKTADASNCIYDINGMRLSVTSLDELPSGLYIVNGKKVIK